MVVTLETVKEFILRFTELEYQFGLAYYDNSISEEEWYDLVAKLQDCYGQRYRNYAIINTTRNISSMTEENLVGKKKNLLKRKLFLIRKFENPLFGKGIVNTDPTVLFSCLLGPNQDIGVAAYLDNVSVGIVDGELKVITERDLNSEKRREEEIIEWVHDKKSNVYIEDIIIKEEGELVETLKAFEPEHPTWLKDYNS